MMNKNEIKLRVLHLEDSARDHELIREVLDEDGIHCHFRCVKNRDDFMASLEREEFDLILSDFAMPGYDGLSALQTAHDTKPETPFIFVSGTIGEERAVESLKNGATDYVLKGNLRRLAPAILRALREAKARAEREQTEAALRQSEKRYRTLFETMDEGFCVIEMIYDPHGKAVDYRFLEINPAFETQMGLKQAVGKTIREMVPNLEAHWFEIFGKVARTGESIRFENPAHSLQRFYDMFAFRIGGDGSQRVGILFNDITERKRVEEALKIAEANYRAIFENAVEGIFQSTPEGRYITMNPAFARIHGYASPEEMIHLCTDISRQAYVNPNKREELKRQLSEVGEAIGFEHEKYRKDGSKIWVSVNARVVRGKNDKPVLYEGSVVDITERKRAEERTRESEALYHSLVENLPQCIFRKDLTGRFTFANQRFCDFVGKALPDLLGKTDADLFPLKLAEQYQEADKRTVETGTPFESVDEIEISGHIKRFIQTIKTPLRGADDQVVGLQGIFWDITEKKNLEAQSLRSQRLESLGTLAGGIAHDLNNMLAPILMSIEILRLKYSEDEANQILGTIESSAQRGAEMVKQVLTFARGVQGERVSLQVDHLIKEIGRILKQTFPKTIETRSAIKSPLCPIVGDATQLHQVLMNLCVNARDAMPDGGTLTLQATNCVIDESFAAMNIEAKAGRYVTISIKDTGTGIPPHVMEKMFDPFFTTKSLEKGTGLGLSTVRGIVKTHGGFIKVLTEIGKGSEFQVFLPVDKATKPSQAETQRWVLPAGHGEVVLVVDDEAAVLNIAKQTLETFGYHVLTANDGSEAIGLCAQPGSRIKLMVTDMIMPILDGPSTIKGVRHVAPSIKIIATSGLDGQANLAGPNQFLIDASLQKPYTAEQLLKTVHRVLSSENAARPTEIEEVVYS